MLQSRLNRAAIPTTFIALAGDALLGSASLARFDMRTRRDLTPWLAAVYVAPEHRRQGVGTQLVGRVVLEAQRLGHENLYLFTPDKEAFYARRGWSVFARTMYEGQQVAVMEFEFPKERQNLSEQG